MRPLLTLLLLFVVKINNGQIKLSGKLLDEKQNPIQNVSVSYKKAGTTVLLGYTKTEIDGRFNLQVKSLDVDSIQLDFNHLSYAPLSVVVRNASASYAYILKAQVRQIEEVKVANMPLFSRKDTINYAVGAFTSKQDRVIADVIKKLPGVQVEGNIILYQGKPIQKLMVNNLDLMEGRYAMINNNLPVDAVHNIQVIENNQPIKILDSLVFSNRASFNIVLKKLTTTGNGKISLGISPLLWDVNLSPMTFDKKFQMLNSLQSNNVGNDAAKDLKSFYTSSGVFGSDEIQQDGPFYVSIRDVSKPDFQEKKWLDNKLFMFTSNLLKKLNSDLEVKGNISFYDDTHKRKGYSVSQYFTANETIVNSEAIDNRYRIHVFDAAVLLEKNVKKVFFRNKFAYHKRWNNDRGDLRFNTVDQIVQQLHYTDESLLNTLVLGRFIGKQLVSIHSTIGFNRTPQRLLVLPGQFQEVLNAGLPYAQMNQQVLHTGVRWSNSLSFIRRIKQWTFTPKIGLNYDRNDLDTYIETVQSGSTIILADDYKNDIRNTQLNLAMSMRIGWENHKWKFDVLNPYNLYYYDGTQRGGGNMNKAIRNTFSPTSSLTYLLNNQHELTTTVGARRSFGGLADFYKGYIINNYRSIQRYDARLLRTDQRNASLGYNYKNVLKASFLNLLYRYSNSNSDFMFATILDAEGRSTRSIVDRSSTTEVHDLSLGLARFLSALKTIIKLNGTLGWSRSDYLLNDMVNQQHVLRRSVTVGLINNASALVSADYKMVINYAKSNFAAANESTVFSNNHFLNFSFFPLDQHSISLNNALYRNNIPNQKDQYFLDVNYRYTIKKWKTDIELTAQNLFNNNQYVTQYATNYELVQSYFELRPMQFLISTRFRF